MSIIFLAFIIASTSVTKVDRLRVPSTLEEGPFMGPFFIYIQSVFTVYIFHSPSFNKIYIGYTSDLDNRLLSHNQLATKGYTVRFRPWLIVHTEDYTTKTEAIKRESQNLLFILTHSLFLR